jgi:hypothetical protein
MMDGWAGKFGCPSSSSSSSGTSSDDSSSSSSPSPSASDAYRKPATASTSKDNKRNKHRRLLLSNSQYSLDPSDQPVPGTAAAPSDSSSGGSGGGSPSTSSPSTGPPLVHLLRGDDPVRCRDFCLAYAGPEGYTNGNHQPLWLCAGANWGHDWRILNAELAW